MTQTLKIGEIWLANLNPRRGTEPGKTRPVLILQDQALLDVEHPSSIIIPLTTNLIPHSEPLRIRVHAQGKLKKDSDLLIDQIRAIDNDRLQKGPLTILNTKTMQTIYAALSDITGANSIRTHT